MFARITTVLQTVVDRLKLKGKSLLPIVQGGMGVGVSAHRLAGTVASLGALGTISSVDLRRHHPDLMVKSGRSRANGLLDSKNLIALDSERTADKQLAGADANVGVQVLQGDLRSAQ